MKIKLLFLSTFMCSASLFAQKHTYLVEPKLTDADVQNMTPSIKSDAPAEILYKSYHYRIDYNGNMYNDIVSRVKIYDKEKANDYLDVEIPLYESSTGSDREKLSNLKAATYNFENGRVKETKVEKDSKFKSTEDKNYNITKFAFADVKNGSVIEYKYTVETPFYYAIPKVMIERDIPVKYIEYVFETPKQLGYTINYQGSLSPTYREVEEKTIYGGDHYSYRFAYDNVPAYKEESFVKNNDNFKTSIKAEINSSVINNITTNFSSTWLDIRKRLYDNEDFGLQLKKMNAVKDILPANIKSIPVDLDRANAILKFVQNKYKWSNELALYTDKGVKSLISSKIGNSAEINLLLVMLMKDAGLKCDPIVLSTVGKGLLTAYAPSVTLLNYVIACVQTGEKFYIYDATSKFSSQNTIPPRAFNSYGFLMTEKEAKQLNVVYPYVSETILAVDAKLNDDGTFSGHFSDTDNNMYAMVNNESYSENKDTYLQQYKNQYKFPYKNIKSGPAENEAFSTSFDFDSDTFVDAIGGKLVFNPLLFLYTKNHDYDQTEPRKAPLEFLSAYNRIKKVTITLPEGYAFSNVPKSKKIRTEENEIVYEYNVVQAGNKLTVTTTTSIDDATYPKEYYPAFKQIFDNITKLEGQVVTAVKK
ncbi:DUF3857 domain-containing protein [Halpernia frigidisoli]|uniref:DUF3857 domain-containing protein n=1 Tax=Halpernia frigidisoli TaxID=1125876 RepID=A0A1I3GGA2_9FLAO|nr:DUF3857 domain-containing protein [Halpernia frigidisoli]SFI22528.1 protein of unknown function [Halpernia frigidisoli]